MSRHSCYCVHVQAIHVICGVSAAKQYMDEVKAKKPKLKKLRESVSEDDPFDALEQAGGMELNLPLSVLEAKPVNKEHVRGRSQTVTSPTGSTGSNKSLRRGKQTSEKRRSTFYVHPAAKDVTTPFIQPMDLETLIVWDRSQEQLLDLINRVRLLALD